MTSRPVDRDRNHAKEWNHASRLRQEGSVHSPSHRDTQGCAFIRQDRFDEAAEGSKRSKSSETLACALRSRFGARHPSGADLLSA